MSNADWWAKRLGAQVPAPPPAAAPVYTPTQVPVPQMPQAYPTQPQSKAQSARLTEMCPGCNSGNYFAATPQHAKRCYDCGYPLSQTGSGLGTGISEAQVEGATKAALQPAMGNGYQPTNIIGKA